MEPSEGEIQMTRLLAVDCAAGACSVAVRDAARILAAAHAAMDRGQAEALMPMIAGVLAEAGIAAGDLGAIAATVGPGSFTGVRIGLAAARGIALAAGLPTVAVTTLEAIAEAAGPGVEPLLVVLDAKRSDVYGQWFGPDGSALDAPRAVPAEALWAARPAGCTAVRIAGDAVALALERRGDSGVDVRAVGDGGPDARAVAELAHRRWLAGTLGSLTPLYLRAPDVTPPR